MVLRDFYYIIFFIDPRSPRSMDRVVRTLAFEKVNQEYKVRILQSSRCEYKKIEKRHIQVQVY